VEYAWTRDRFPLTSLCPVGIQVDPCFERSSRKETFCDEKGFAILQAVAYDEKFASFQEGKSSGLEIVGV
jgi:hypothetical protein